MKILKIEIENIAALEGLQIIDFEKEPLKDSTLFAITGKTGSGKSTILDSICLALYGKVPKLEQSNDGGTEINDDVTNKNVRTLLRKGAGEGKAVVTFRDDAGDIYRATWYCNRAHKKANGALQRVRRILEKKHEGKFIAIIDNKGPEVNQKIVEIIGLTYDEFTRSVILAQGDFASFLKASDNDKASILEKITQTDIFTRISEIIHQHKVEEQEKYIRIEDKMAGITVPQKEEKDEKNNLLNVLTSQLKVNEKEKKELENRKEKKTQYTELTQGIAENNERLLVNQHKKEQLSEISNKIRLTEQTRDIRAMLVKEAELTKARNNYAGQIEKESLNLERLKKEYQIKSEGLQKAQIILQESKARYEDLTEDITKARQLDSDIKAKRLLYEAKGKETQELSKEIKKEEREIENLRKRLEVTQNSLKVIADEVEKLKRFEDLENEKDQILSYSKDLDNARKKIKKYLSEDKEAAKDLEQQDKLLIEVEKRIEMLNKITPLEVIKVHKMLKCGEECPVCRQKVQKIPQIKTEEGQLSADKIESEHIEATRHQTEITHRIEVLKEQISRNKEEKNILKQDIQSLVNDMILILGKYYPEISEKDIDFKLMDKVNEDIMHLKNASKEELKLEQERNLSKERLDEKDKLIKLQKEKYQQRKREVEEIERGLNEIIETRKGLLGGADTEEFNKAEKKKVDDALKNKDKAQSDESHHKELVKTTETKIEGLDKNFKEYSEELKLISESLNNTLTEKDLSREMLYEINIFEKNQYEGSKKTIKAIEDLITSTKAIIEEKKTALDKLVENNREIIESEESITQILESIHQKENEISHNRELKGQIQQIIAQWEKDEERIQSLQKEKEKQYEKTRIYEELDQLYGGTEKTGKFKRIAQARTLKYLVMMANNFLKELNNRYQMECKQDGLSIYVKDSRNLNECRTVNTLSGGETFQCSLALALALSTISKGSFSTENLFIDEGFGTLDSNSLDEAIATLDNLSNSGSKIGIISHVGALKERIGTQIEVVQRGGLNGSRIYVHENISQ